MCHIGAPEGHLEAILGGLEIYLGPPWGNFGQPWGHLGAILGGLGGYLGPHWVHFLERRGNIKKTWNLSCSTLGDIAHTKGECRFYAGFIDVFRLPLGWLKHHHVPCRGHIGAIFGGLGSYLGQLWGILCHVEAILKELGGY